jgi:AraC family transcriptional regulator
MSEVEYPEVRKCGLHAHEQAFFAILLQGSYEERYGRRCVAHRRMSVAFRPAGMAHRDHISAPGTRFFIIEIAKHWEDRMREYLPHWSAQPVMCSGDATWLAARLYDGLRSSIECSPLVVKDIVLDLLVSASRSYETLAERSPRWLGVAVDLINSEFSQALGLAKIASQVGVHPAYLSRIFRTVHRESVGHYVNRLRVRYAGVELAKDPSTPLCELALAAGFADQSQFTKIFKQISGITPGAFRNSIRARVGDARLRDL